MLYLIHTTDYVHIFDENTTPRCILLIRTSAKTLAIDISQKWQLWILRTNPHPKPRSHMTLSAPPDQLGDVTVVWIYI